MTISIVTTNWQLLIAKRYEIVANHFFIPSKYTKITFDEKIIPYLRINYKNKLSIKKKYKMCHIFDKKRVLIVYGVVALLPNIEIGTTKK